MKGLVYDSTGIGYFEADGAVPKLEDLNAAIAAGKVKEAKLKPLAEVELTKPVAILKLTIKGLG